MRNKNNGNSFVSDDSVYNDYVPGGLNTDKNADLGENEYRSPQDAKRLKTQRDYLNRESSSTGNSGSSVAPNSSPYYTPPKPENQFVPRKQKKRHIAGKLILCLILIFILFILGIGCYAYMTFDSLLEQVNYVEYDDVNDYISSSSLYSSDSVLNILVIGVDDDNGTGVSRSDSMMLVSLDTENEVIKLTSFLRDMWVYIPGYSYAKLNAACTYGGADLVIDTIEYNFRVDIDGYVLIDFDTFIDIVDALGGITVDVSESEAAAMAEFDCIVEAGENVHLDGEQTLWYARIRKNDSDFARTERQREVATLLLEKLSQKNISEILELARVAVNGVETSLTTDEIKSLLFNTSTMTTFLSYLSYDIEQLQIPQDGTWWNSTISSQAVLEFDSDANIEALYNFLYNDVGE